MGILSKEAEAFQVRIFISDQALNRLKRDKYIQQKITKFYNIISMITKSKLNCAKEKIGDFWLSPRGHIKERVVWSFEIDTKNKIIMLKIVDLIYHINDTDYVDDWNIEAKTKKLVLANYGPYKIFES